MGVPILASFRSGTWGESLRTARSPGAVWIASHGRFAGFLGIVSVSALVCWRPISALLQVAWRDEQYTYVLMILPVSVCLLFLEPKPTMPLRCSWRVGGTLLLCAVAMGAWGAMESAGAAANNRLSLTMLALVTFWIGAFVLCFGAGAFKALRFPLLFLFLMVPLPNFLLERIVYFLQSGSTEVAYFLFRLFEVPVRQSGFVLSLPGVDIEIAEQCSGIRSSTALLVASLALSHLYLRSGWNQLLVGASVLPLAILKNGLRVFVLSTLAVYVDPNWLEGRFHRSGGFLFFALALAAVTALMVLLRRSERKTAETGRARQFSPESEVAPVEPRTTAQLACCPKPGVIAESVFRDIQTTNHS